MSRGGLIIGGGGSFGRNAATWEESTGEEV